MDMILTFSDSENKNEARRSKITFDKDRLDSGNEKDAELITFDQMIIHIRTLRC
jgi:hypothetical protein